MPTDVTEKQVLEIWQDSLQGRTDLKTVENEPVRSYTRGAATTTAALILKTRLSIPAGSSLRVISKFMLKPATGGRTSTTLTPPITG